MARYMRASESKGKKLLILVEWLLSLVSVKKDCENFSLIDPQTHVIKLEDAWQKWALQLIKPHFYMGKLEVISSNF